MHRTEGAGHVGNQYSDGVPGVDEATVVEEDSLNAFQEEIIAPIEAAGIPLVKGTNNQLLAALPKQKGYLGQLGFLQTGDPGFSGAAGDLEIRQFVIEVAGRFTDKTATTVLVDALSDITADGWYAITVAQDGTVAIQGSPATPLGGAIAARPTGGGDSGGFDFEDYSEDLQGFYKNATTRFLMAVWIDQASDAVLYAVRLADGSDESGSNTRGDWQVKNGIMRAETVISSLMNANTALGNIFREATPQSLSWPHSFVGNPRGEVQGRPSAGGAYVWGVTSNVYSSTQAQALVLLSAVSGNTGYVHAVGYGAPSHL